LKARRGDLSGPVLAILVTLILLAIGAAIIAYFTLFAGQAPTPVLAVRDQPIAYKSGTGPAYDATVEVVVANIGTAQVTLKGTNTKLRIVSPSGLVTTLGAGAEVSLGTDTTIAPGESKTLTFTFNGAWSNFASYRSAGAVLILKDPAGNTIGQFEVSIRIVSSS
jgi:Kef-type K+ transport system membrane component KefB